MNVPKVMEAVSTHVLTRLVLTSVGVEVDIHFLEMGTLVMVYLQCRAQLYTQKLTANLSYFRYK